jgi:MFS family permease
MAEGAGPARTVAVGSAALTTAALPFFLLGALSLSIRDDLGIAESAIGALATMLFLAGAVFATPAGRLVDRVGASVGWRLGVSGTALASLAIGLVATRWWQFAVAMVVVGACMAMIDTSGARAFADRIRPGRQGTAFGIKEASIPAASMAAGVAIPTLAAHFGWRATFLAAVAFALVVLLGVPSRAALAGATPARVVRGRIASAGTIRFAAGLALGTGAATAAAAFLVPTFVDRGLAQGQAGIVLAVSSLAAIAARVGVGRLADLPEIRPVVVLSAMLGIGAVGAAVLITPAPPVLAIVGAIVVIGAGWGWTGLAFLAVVRANPHTPGAAAGVVLAGLGSGGALGPLVFGILAERASYTASWTFVAAGMALGCLVSLSARGALTVAAPPGVGPVEPATSL